MPDFRGGHLAEPLVGEVVATRSFRVDCTGTLLPLYSHEAWYDGVNTATCRPPSGRGISRRHAVPDESCECGFYAYGTVAAAGRNRNTRHVQAVVSCWGGLIAGTQGIRSEHARIDALWLSPRAPQWLRQRIAVRYPSAQVYTDRDVMLAEHPLTGLPCYRPPQTHRASSTLLGALAVLIGALGLLPTSLLGTGSLLGAVWLAAIGGALLAAGYCLLGLRGPGHVAAAGLFLLVAAWLAAPVLGLYGWLVRVPLLHAVLVALGGYLLSLRPWHFPVLEYERPAGSWDRRF